MDSEAARMSAAFLILKCWETYVLVNFKIALAIRKLRQVDFALRCRIDPTLLSLIINERRAANTRHRAKLSKALGVSESWLFSRRKRVA
jgi:transcriptional regulator with XRE-family HTH domain